MDLILEQSAVGAKEAAHHEHVAHHDAVRRAPEARVIGGGDHAGLRVDDDCVEILFEVVGPQPVEVEWAHRHGSAHVAIFPPLQRISRVAPRTARTAVGIAAVVVRAHPRRQILLAYKEVRMRCLPAPHLALFAARRVLHRATIVGAIGLAVALGMDPRHHAAIVALEAIPAVVAVASQQAHLEFGIGTTVVTGIVKRPDALVGAKRLGVECRLTDPLTAV